MKYNDVITMMNCGIMAATSHSLNLNAAYTVTKFKRELDRLFNEWRTKYEALPKEAEIEDGETFDKRREELTKKVQEGKLSNAEAKELDAMNEKMERLQGLRVKLAEDDVTITVTPMSYEDWFTFKNDNKDIKNGQYELLDLIEIPLENILWKAPEE